MAVEQSVEQFKRQPRLPKFAVPRRYDLSFKIDLDGSKFSGSVEITVDIVAATRFLVLNAADLAVDQGSVWFRIGGSYQELRPKEILLVKEDQILIIIFNDVLPIGEGVLRLRFKGTLNDQIKGFYRSTYDVNGDKKYMAVTQFEAADARRCFPCWDEPAFKATFKIALKVPAEQIALSNMPVINEKVDGLSKHVSFQETPIMSTYLVAIVVGLFEYIQEVSPDGTRVRVYTQMGKSNKGKFALNIAVKTLELYTKYFSVPYPLPKLDMIAIPGFAAGAMDNYGLVTFREIALLYDDLISSASGKQSVTITVTHELAHQWFGNLVTMEWWTHLWLTEGFATWMSYLAADSLFPDWKIWTQFLDETSPGFRLDALTESHPIEVDINHASEIDEIFDYISYNKGASVIRMLESYLGAEIFQKSLASYIEIYAYSNAKTEDLWSILEEESDVPVKDLMSSWTKQRGYPVVHVKLNKGVMEFDQSHFLSDGTSGEGQWIVPLTLCRGSYNEQKKFLLKLKYDKFDIKELFGLESTKNRTLEKGDKGKVPSSWIKINVNQTGFYRVQYDTELAAELRYAIERNELSTADRFGILEDSYALCVARREQLSQLLYLLTAYKQESEYTVLSHIITISRRIRNVVADAAPELLDGINIFFTNLLQFSAEKLGWDKKEGESNFDTMLRGELLNALVLFGDVKIRNEAVRRFSAFLKDRHSPLLPPDIRTAAYVAIMQTVSTLSRSGFESLLKIYRETKESEEKVRVIASLASCPDKDIVLEALNFILSSEVRNQDAVYWLDVSREGRETAWKWLKENWDFISKTWSSSSLLSCFVGSIVSLLYTEEKAKEIEDFFASRLKPSFARTLKQSLERIRINARLIESIRKEGSLGELVKKLADRK